MPVALERTLAATLLLLVTPLVALLALALRLAHGAPVLFRQTRPGLGGEPFTIFKFRTMRDALGPDGRPRSDAERLTRLGKVVRALSLDELPQLWNVLRGDMSLVGPRPLLMEYLPRYTAEQARRHEVRPGITGWAQVHGRNAISWEQKFALDVWYVDNRTMLLDCKIVLLTMLRVLRRDGVSARGEATMPEFLGTGAGVHGGSEGSP